MTPPDQPTPPVRPHSKPLDHKHCFSCGLLMHDSVLMCPHCSAEQPLLPTKQAIGPLDLQKNNNIASPLKNQVYCHGCGRQIHSQALSCPQCGAPQRTGSGAFNHNNNHKDRITAALLAFFLGALGGHKFYLGSPVAGVFYVLFFWTFIPSIIGCIEAVVYLSMSNEEFSKRYD